MTSFYHMDRIHLHDNAFLDLPISLSSTERKECLVFTQHALTCHESEKASVLASLPISSQSSSASVSILHTLLTTGTWPVFDVQCAYARAWKNLPENVKGGHPSSESIMVAAVEKLIRTTYSGLTSLFRLTDQPSLVDSSSHTSSSHKALSDFVHNFAIPNSSGKSRIAIALPNGPALGLAIIATAAYYTAFPLSVSSGAEQFRNNLLQSEASSVLVIEADVSRLGLEEAWVGANGIQVITVELKDDLTFSMRYQQPPSDPVVTVEPPMSNGPDDIALMLFTSGTSGAKKVVPITVHALVSGVAFVIQSWGLTANDVCLNMMPLFHVGGIVRNLFAPILAGGSTICCSAFDANSFWDIVEDLSPSWYYASPTMHQMILETSRHRQSALEKSKIRLVANAAGGLLPSLANDLRDTFNCTVLPSYGMTECMPISSPPLDYKLDRPGTSGVSVGPDLGILDGHGNAVPAREVGKIAVRGAPLFGGYLRPDGITDRTPFDASAWFDTGDMGYLDEDGYLYVTGRSKEVINRGGELISPFEVEEAVLSASQTPNSPIEGRVSAVLAFSMPHDVLQEVVGLVLVTPPETLKVCIKTVQQAIKSSLSSVKWPQVIVFMDDLPKNNNKILRIGLAERMGMRAITDDVPLGDRHYTAVCPPVNVALSEKIPSAPHVSDLDSSARWLSDIMGPDYDVYVRPSEVDAYPEAFIAPAPYIPSHMRYTSDFDPAALIRGKIDDLDMPVDIHLLDVELPEDKLGDIDHDELDRLVGNVAGIIPETSEMTSAELKVADMFAQILACPLSKLSRDSDFFEMGGDSLRAGKLLSELRKASRSRIPVESLFKCGQISALATYIEQTTHSIGHPSSSSQNAEVAIEKTRSSTTPFLLCLQLIPMVLLYPMKRALTWTIFMYVLAETQSWPTEPYVAGRILNLILALAVGRLVTFSISPLVGILVKWVLIGRYQEGLYPMWGIYHTRWWLVEKAMSVCGRGLFGRSNWGIIQYYRLLGAKIGSGATIAPSATLGEYDLIEIGDDAVLDKCTCRPFGVEKNTAMYLGRVKIGKNASVGLNSIVAPGTSVADGVCIGPNSSSWESDGADEGNRDLSANRIPGAHWSLELFICAPLSGLVNLVRSGPWIGGLYEIVKLAPQDDPDKILAIIQWLSEPYRVAFHYLALIFHALFGPMAWFLAILIIRKLVDVILGKQRPGPVAQRSELQKLRMSLFKRTIPLKRFHQLIELSGVHYEITSVLYRLMGAKVGQRVYWPGTGPSVQDFDLLDIGDDVVFGSRSHLVTSDGYGSDSVKVGNGAMISDRVVLLPGTTVGDRTVFGSGALSRRSTQYPADTVWTGSRGGEAICLSNNQRKVRNVDGLPRKDSKISNIKTVVDKKMTEVTTTELVGSSSDLEKDGSAITLSGLSSTTTLSPSKETTSSSTPFGRAFYEGKAPYHVLSLSSIILYSSFTTIFTTFYWNTPTTVAVQLVSRLLPHLPSLPTGFRALAIYALFTFSISVLQTALAILALAICIAAKWVLLGHRKPGSYDWDKSSYCQRWQVYLTIERLRRHCFGGQGVLGLLTGTHWMVLYFRLLGATIGKDVALFAGGNPSCLLTEPDLLTIGDRAVVDDASLVGHINSRGEFRLNELHVGEGSVLRSGSRLLSGAKMGKGAVLMEHTLVMAGDEVGDGAVLQGWPSEGEWDGKRMPTIGEQGGAIRLDGEKDGVKT